MEDISYSPASADDLPAIKALLDLCDLPAEDLGPAHLQHFVTCRAGERIVGTVGVEPLGETGLLRSLAVAPDFRGKSLARELWARARQKATRMGVSQLYLLTTTADGLFARWGFKQVPRDEVAELVRSTSQYSAICPTTAVVMAIDLTAKALTA
jgi:amino-acid N-acetyltransferase